MTAYFGLYEVGQPKAGETVVVSAASGAVGQVVGQLAKIAGCRAVGIAGGAKKCAFVKDTLGFDACIDYKAEKDLAAAVKAACPNGVDVYFDNVGGPVSDAVLANLNFYARVALCGSISQYNTAEPGPRLLGTFVGKRVTARGFIVWDFNAELRPARCARWASGCARAASSTRRTSSRGSIRRRAPSSACCAARTSARCRCGSGPSRRGRVQ